MELILLIVRACNEKMRALFLNKEKEEGNINTLRLRKKEGFSFKWKFCIERIITE